ncbi:hypothetical protein [Rhodovulum adriaticum]|uniref:Uncharacterized protein n=1 Tax=Rhodovulum adriaticum TaxID=35804 RepID=A0A4R2P0V2_RHOAD|nr:hypothetical protein [Rhodovulum adriaticum]TCP27265.1 hypothetical protein EV656_101168 [Rhodovulum adriaticum]
MTRGPGRVKLRLRDHASPAMSAALGDDGVGAPGGGVTPRVPVQGGAR